MPLLLTIIVSFFDMRREAERTLFSLSTQYQKGISPEQYQVLAIDNGSSQALDPTHVQSFGPNFSYHYFETSSKSPAVALNYGISLADSPYIMLMIDGARMLSPGLLAKALEALQTFENPFVYTLSLHLGAELQNDAMLRGYNKEVEDQLLASINWQEDGYQLFGISNFHTHRYTYLDEMFESNCIAMRSDTIKELGAFDERFQTSGGGLVNLELFERYVCHEHISPVSLIGEASFHQLHGGVSTNIDRKKHPLKSYKEEYKELMGKVYEPPQYVAHYWGRWTEEMKSTSLDNRLIGLIAYIRELVHAQKFATAKQIMMELKKEWPHNHSVSLAHLHLLLAMHKNEKALAVFAQLIESQFEPNSELYATMAKLCVNLGKLELAEHYAQQALAQDDQSFYAHNQLGRIALARNQSVEAIRAFEQGLQIPSLSLPMQTHFRISLCKLYLQQGQFQQAQTIAQTAAQSTPANLEVLHILIRASLLVGDQASAAEVCKTCLDQLKAETLDIPAHSLLNNLGEHLLQLKQYHHALSVFDYALEKTEAKANAQLGKGKAYYFLKQHEQSIVHLWQAYQLGIEHAAFYKLLGHNYHALDQQVQAQSFFTKAISLTQNRQLQTQLKQEIAQIGKENISQKMHRFYHDIYDNPKPSDQKVDALIKELESMKEHIAVRYFLLGKLYLLQLQYPTSTQYFLQANKHQILFDPFILEWIQKGNEAFVHDLVNIGNAIRNKLSLEDALVFYQQIREFQIRAKIVNRTTLIQRLIDQHHFPNYLEIGVFVGHNFLQIQANNCVAVDPQSQFGRKKRFSEQKKYHQMTSDAYFHRQVLQDFPEGIDIAFIDGLHTYEQARRDVLNCLKYLKPHGFILMHDCFPKTAAAAHPEMKTAQKMPDYEGFWNGDVYKTILWLRTCREDLHVAVLDKDHGLGIVRRRKAENMLSLTDQEIKEMAYPTFANKAHSLLNIQQIDELSL